MKKIKNIVVPTDFSVSARNAFFYAQGLAEVLNATLTVVHVKEYFLPISELTMTPFFEIEEENLLAEALESFIGGESAEDSDVMTATQVQTRILRGDPVTTLIDVSNEEDCDLMIVGTNGEHNFFTKIFGSTSLHLANKAHCPVILVPIDAFWTPVKRLMYVSNYDAMTPEMIRNAGLFARALRAVIHFVHVPDSGNEPESKAAQLLWEQLFSLTGPNMPYQATCVFGKDIITELEQYNEEQHIDLTVFVSKHRSFWENLFQKNMAQSMALTAHAPIMIMHLKQGED